jgi:hypothetical protein
MCPCVLSAAPRPVSAPVAQHEPASSISCLAFAEWTRVVYGEPKNTVLRGFVLQSVRENHCIEESFGSMCAARGAVCVCRTKSAATATTPTPHLETSSSMARW